MKSLIAKAVAPILVAVNVAVGTQPAQRSDLAITVGATCDTAVVTALARRHPNVGQFIVMQTPSWSASTGTVEVAARNADGEWLCQSGPRVARFGRTGTRPLVDRRSGDGTTPAGVFPLGLVTAWDGQVFSMFGNRPNPGVRAPFRDVRVQDCWGAIPGASDYGKLVAKQGCPGPDDEWLPRFGDVYEYAAVIGANLNPISGDAPGEPAYAAAIFLHRHAYTVPGTTQGSTKPTSGCVSLADHDLIDTLRLIDPARTPHFAIGPRAYLTTTA